MTTKDALVEKIKAMQRASPELKQLWWDHCDQNLGGSRDPNRHDQAVLQEFLDNAPDVGDAPAAPPRKQEPSSRGKSGGKGKGKDKDKGYSYAASCGGGFGMPFGGDPFAMMQQMQQQMQQMSSMYGMGMMEPYSKGKAGPMSAGPGAGASNELAMFIKTGQRVSQHWKEAWRAYCSTYGQNFFDPARYDDTFLIGFIDWAGRLTEANLSPVVPQQHSVPSFSGGGPPRKRPSEGAGGPPAKRYAGGGPLTPVNANSGDPEKDALVAQIKELQRNDPNAKQAWIDYTTESHGGIRDPARHEKETLETFLANFSF